MNVAKHSSEYDLQLNVGETLVSVACVDAALSGAALLESVLADSGKIIRREGSASVELLFSRPLQAVQYALTLLEGKGGRDLRIGVLHLGHSPVVTQHDVTRAQFIRGEAPAGSMALCLRSYCAASELFLDHHWLVSTHGSELNNEVEFVVATGIPPTASTGAFSTFAGLSCASAGAHLI